MSNAITNETELQEMLDDQGATLPENFNKLTDSQKSELYSLLSQVVITYETGEINGFYVGIKAYEIDPVSREPIDKQGNIIPKTEEQILWDIIDTVFEHSVKESSDIEVYNAFMHLYPTAVVWTS